MKRHLGSILTMSAALGCGLAFYVVSLKVGAERAAVEGLRGAITQDLADSRALAAELRTRARLPQLQRWNDEVLALAAPAPAQFKPGVLYLVSAEEALRPAPAPALARGAPAVRPPLVIAAAILPTPSPLAKAEQRVAGAARLEPRVVLARAPSPALADLDRAIARELDAAAVADPLHRVALR